MYNLAVSANGVPVSGGGAFIRRCVTELLAWDLIYFIAFAIGILIVCWLVRFIITLKEDK